MTGRAAGGGDSRRSAAAHDHVGLGKHGHFALGDDDISVLRAGLSRHARLAADGRQPQPSACGQKELTAG